MTVCLRFRLRSKVEVRRSFRVWRESGSALRGGRGAAKRGLHSGPRWAFTACFRIYTPPPQRRPSHSDIHRMVNSCGVTRNTVQRLLEASAPSNA